MNSCSIKPQRCGDLQHTITNHKANESFGVGADHRHPLEHWLLLFTAAAAASSSGHRPRQIPNISLSEIPLCDTTAMLCNPLK